MTWLRLDDQFHRHRKVAPLSDRAFRLHVTVMLECANQLTDGWIDCALVPTLPRAPTSKAALKKVTDELEESGLWIRHGAQWEVHDFLDWNPPASTVLKKKEEARERMRKARETKESQTDAFSSRNVRANTSRTEPKVREPLSRSSPNPVPVPVPVPGISKAAAADSGLPGSDNSHPIGASAPAAAAAVAHSVASDYKPARGSSSLDEVLAMPIGERAKWLLAEAQHRGDYYRPNTWPEVVAVAEALHSSARLAPPRLGPYGRDAGVRSLVDAFAAGYPANELLEVARRLPGTAWWKGRVESGNRPGLSWLTLEVIRREASALPQAKPVTSAIIEAANYARSRAKAVANG